MNRQDKFLSMRSVFIDNKISTSSFQFIINSLHTNIKPKHNKVSLGI